MARTNEMHSEGSNDGAVSPIDSLLGRYAAGALDPALHALVEAHLELKSKNRAFVRALEEIEGDLLLDIGETPLATRQELLERIFGDHLPVAPRVLGHGQLPASVRRLIGQDLGDIRWRSKLPGVKEFRIDPSKDANASLFWIDAGRSIPSHTHDGTETTLVLRGAFSDVNGRYDRGDIVIADSEVDHRPVVDAGGDCLCFAVTEGHLHLTGPFGRIVDRLFGPGR